MKKSTCVRRRLAWMTAAVMLLSTVHAAAFSDTAGHWAEETLTAWQEQGRIDGYSDGSFHPDASVTRAGFVKMLNHALGFTAESDISFSDMKETDWFYTEVARAAAAGYAQGSGGAFRPNQAVTRAEAAVMIARAAGLAASVERADAFADAASIPAWAKGGIGAAAKAGFMNGYSDGAFHADNLITRAQAVATLDRVLRSAQDTVIEKSGTVLENETVTGDLIIAASVGEGAVTLKNVTVLGNLIVRGGASSVDLDGVRVSGAVQLQKENVRLHLSGNTALDRVEIAQPCRITRDGGFQGTLGTLVIDLAKTGRDVRIEVPAERVEILSRANVVLNTDVEQLILGEDAERTQLEIQRGATVGRLTADARVKLTGSGRVSTLEVSVSGVTVGSGLTVKKTETENGAKAPSAASGGSSGGRSLKVITGAAPVAVQVDYGTEADAALAALPATVTLNLRDGSTVDAVATAWKWTEPVSNILTGTTAAYTAEGTFTVPSGCTYSGTAVVRATVTVRPLKTGAFTAALAAARAKQAGFTEEIDAAGATDPDTIYVLPDGTAEAAVTKDVQFIWAGNAAYTALKAAVTRAEPYANPEKFGSQTACDNLTAELTAAVDGIGNLTVMTGKNYTAAYVRAQIKK